MTILFLVPKQFVSSRIFDWCGKVYKHTTRDLNGVGMFGLSQIFPETRY